MLEVSFYIPGTPVGLGRQRTKPMFKKGGGFSHVQNYKPAKSASYENLVKMAASSAMMGRPPIAGPVRMTLVIDVIRPKSHYRSGKNAHLLKDDAPLHVTTKPDCSNILKGIEDGMNGIVYLDDKQIFDPHVTKRYSADGTAGVNVWVDEVSNHIPDDVRFEGIVKTAP